MPGTLRPDGGQFGTVQAHLAGGKTVTLGLVAMQGHWYLYDVMTAQAGAQAAGPASAQLASMQLDSAPVNHVPTVKEIRQRTPVIFIHGITGSSKDFGGAGDPYRRCTPRSTGHTGPGSRHMTTRRPTTQWVNVNGPNFAATSAGGRGLQGGHGPGKVIVVSYSMGGLITRARPRARHGPDISMVITIGTPNTGSFWSNVLRHPPPGRCTNAQFALNARPAPGSFCAQWTALAGMASFRKQISGLPALPSGIPLNAIAGDETVNMLVGYAWARSLPLFGDGVVLKSSALYQRPGGNPARVQRSRTRPGSRTTSRPCTPPCRPTRRSSPGCASWSRTGSRVTRSRRWPPAQAAPTLGSDAYWLAGGGKWFVHGAQLQIFPRAATDSEASSNMIGTMTWNAGGNVIIGTQHLTFVSQPDGSLKATFTDAATYAYPTPLPAGLIMPSPGDAPQPGDTFTLVPIAPMHAKEVWPNPPASWAGGNDNWCQAGLPNASQYCGA